MSRKSNRRRKPMSYVYDAITNRSKNRLPVWFTLPVGLVLDLLSFTLKIFKAVLVLIFACICIGIGGAIYVWSTKVKPVYEDYDKLAREVVQLSTAETFMTEEASFIYDSDGEILAKLRGDNDSSYLPYSQIPQNVINAFVAVEDRTFWDNPGFDIKGIARVCVNYLQTDGGEVHGASTITQQLARGAFLSREVSIERKAKEILISKYMTEKYTKEQIMEYYVNDICYSNGIYGIEAASLAYFNKHASDLTLSQTAYLCAIPNSPTMYNPYNDYTRAIPRRDKILKDMLEMDYISKQEYDHAISEPIVIEKSKTEFNNYQTTFAVDCVVKYLMKQNNFQFKYVFKDNAEYNNYIKEYNFAYDYAKNDLYTGGYSVYTTLDSQAQSTMQTALDSVLAFDTELGDDETTYALQGAVTCIDNSNGKVIAVVGGRSQDSIDTYGINRAYQSYRQPGSSIKPLVVYGPALENGYRPTSIVHNIDVSKAKEKGVDVQSLTGQQMTLVDALTYSKNGVAWQIFDKLTPNVCMKHITDMHYSKVVADDYYNSASLGGFTYGVTTVEQASGYSTIVNHGKYREPTCISALLDSNGVDIYRDADAIDVYSSHAADQLVDMMQNVVTRGTAAGMKWDQSSQLPAIAKTGTTNDSKDGWLCGATPYYTVAVWVGYDTPRTLDNLWGSTYPAQIWKQCMLAMTEGKEVTSFTKAPLDDSVDQNTDSEILPGRSDDELLSDNYYVADYRADRAIGEQVQAVLTEMTSLDMGQPGSLDTLNVLRTNAQELVDSIYSRSYTSEMQSALDQCYNTCTSKLLGLEQTETTNEQSEASN